MKKILFPTLLCIMAAVILSSCGTTEQPTTDWQAVRALLEQYADYTYANYAQNQYVEFRTETGEVAEYQVFYSSFLTIAAANEPENPDTEDVGTSEPEDIRIVVGLQSPDEPTPSVLLSGYCPDKQGRVIAWELGVDTTQLTPAVQGRRPSFALEGDDLYLENAAGQWMLLRRGIGIARMGDAYGHTWRVQ